MPELSPYIPCISSTIYMVEVKQVAAKLSSYNCSMATELLICPTSPKGRNKLRQFMKAARAYVERAQEVEDDEMRMEGTFSDTQQDSLTTLIRTIRNLQDFMPANEERFASIMKPHGGEAYEKE